MYLECMTLDSFMAVAQEHPAKAVYIAGICFSNPSMMRIKNKRKIEDVKVNAMSFNIVLTTTNKDFSIVRFIQQIGLSIDADKEGCKKLQEQTDLKVKDIKKVIEKAKLNVRDGELKPIHS